LEVVPLFPNENMMLNVRFTISDEQVWQPRLINQPSGHHRI